LLPQQNNRASLIPDGAHDSSCHRNLGVAMETLAGSLVYL
jgi:hypothetical protein